jgi:hypothetical protein
VASLTWPYGAVADALFTALAEAHARIELEQSRRGLDAYDEVELHPLFAASLIAAGFSCAREQRYPSAAEKKKRSAGPRCDLVVGDGGADDDRLWIEVKVAARFKPGGRAGGSARIAWRDVLKLAGEETLRRRAVLLVLFTEDERVAAADLEAWRALGRARGLLLDAPVVHARPIVDRYGNGAVAAALFPIAGLAHARPAPRRRARSSVG